VVLEEGACEEDWKGDGVGWVGSRKGKGVKGIMITGEGWRALEGWGEGCCV
jgi:hypothetical protein